MSLRLFAVSDAAGKALPDTKAYYQLAFFGSSVLDSLEDCKEECEVDLQGLALRKRAEQHTHKKAFSTFASSF